MKTPDWNKAPIGATHLTMDQNLQWHWHFTDPEIFYDHWYSPGMVPASSYTDWKKCCERRPEKTKAP